jgi:DNA mismatch endonuclease (patch repair protein)
MPKSKNKIFCEVCDKEFAASAFMRHLTLKGESHSLLLHKFEEHRRMIESTEVSCYSCGNPAKKFRLTLNEAMADMFGIRRKSRDRCDNKVCKKSWNAGLTKDTNDVMKRIALSRMGEANPIHVIMKDESRYALWIENCKKGAAEYSDVRRGKTYDDIFGHEKSAEIKAKLSTSYSQRNKFPNAGNRHTDETKEKIAHKVSLYWSTRQGKTSKPQLEFYEFLSEALQNEEIFLEHVDGRFSIDIAIPKFKIAIEVDGDFFHVNEALGFKLSHPIQERTVKNDIRKNSYLEKLGWTVLRFWVSDIEKDKSCLLQKIINQISLMKLSQ